MSYLTHIIDNYDDLTDITVFMHGAASQWHNDLEDESSSFLLSKLRLDSVNRKGYTNLRCQSRPGCPLAMRPSDPKFTSMDDVVYTNFTSIYTELFDVPNEQIPNEIGGICCGQFALTKERIRQRRREEYIHMRDWALSTPLDNFTVGSVFEMLWHIIFRENSVSYVLVPILIVSLVNCAADVPIQNNVIAIFTACVATRLVFMTMDLYE